MNISSPVCTLLWTQLLPIKRGCVLPFQIVQKPPCARSYSAASVMLEVEEEKNPPTFLHLLHSNACKTVINHSEISRIHLTSLSNKVNSVGLDFHVVLSLVNFLDNETRRKVPRTRLHQIHWLEHKRVGY